MRLTVAIAWYLSFNKNVLDSLTSFWRIFIITFIPAAFLAYNSYLFCVITTVICFAWLQQLSVLRDYNSYLFCVITTVICFAWLQQLSVLRDYNSYLFCVITTVICFAWLLHAFNPYSDLTCPALIVNYLLQEIIPVWLNALSRFKKLQYSCFTIISGKLCNKK